MSQLKRRRQGSIRVLTPEQKERKAARHKVYMRELYANDITFRTKQLERVRENNRRLYEEARQEVAGFKAGGCVVCGERELVSLCCHHLDPSQKKFTIGHVSSRSYGLRQIKEELGKCVCLCHNCHAKLHAGLVALA